ncbi:MAG: ribosome silencing factor [Myxococcota bacterium]|nr:ribosome silencing factor [Myxococcota bacterium]
MFSVPNDPNVIEDFKREFTIDTNALTKIIVQALYRSKATDIRILNLEGLISYCDRFVVCSASSIRQVRAIADNLMMELKKKHAHMPLGIEGKGQGQWILLDYEDVIVHVFSSEAREYYTLDSLWMDAPLIPLDILEIEEQEEPSDS